MTSLIPRELLFGNPTRANAQISPSGKLLGYIAPVDGVLNVWVGPVDGEATPLTTDTDRGIRAWSFAQDGRHLLYVQDQGGDENWHVYATDLDTGHTRDLTPFDAVQAQIVKAHRDFPDTILVGINKDNPQLHDVYRLTLSTGELVKEIENPGFLQWIADDLLAVRCGVAPTPDGGLAVMHRTSTTDEWVPVLAAAQEDALSTGPIGFTGPTTLLCQSSVEANTSRLVSIDVTTGAAEVLYEDPTFDVATAMVHPVSKVIQMVGVMRDRLEWEVWDESIRGDIDGIRALAPDAYFGVVSRDRADERWVVGFDVDDGSTRYQLWDRATKSATFLFDAWPELAEHELVKMRPFSFTARDGLELHGYVTFPGDVEPVGLPAVLNVHGGPWARDTWGYNAEAQWLANRGYACIQVNFRGSTGYGKAFTSAGDKEWGAKMHDDLLDTIDHCAAEGWIDPARVAIYGGSYGGYAALVGATFTPERFVCAVDLVGPSNIATLIESVPEYWKPMIKQFTTRVGDPVTEKDFLWSRSPLSKVDNVSIPLLIAQGANDPRVKQAESEQIVEALKEKGIAHEYLLYEDEGHGFAKPENRLHFYGAVERFLARHLGGRCEDQATDLEG